jgi:transaldolase/glucose-6-phosphate isomerase
MVALEGVGVSLGRITEKLVEDGIKLFADAFSKLLDAIEERRGSAYRPHVERLGVHLPSPLAAAVSDAVSDWQENRKAQRLWARDASLWTGADEDRWLGWLGITDDQLAYLDRFRTLAGEVRATGFTDALLLGMGGSSLCPEVLATTFGRTEGFPRLHVLDSTDPAQIARVAAALDLTRTLVIVSSKSGTTLEPNILLQYFFACVSEALGAREAARRFVAITDPGAKLQQVAEQLGFRRVCFGSPSIGGRYSALSDFGLVPAAVMGLDVARLLDRADEMVQSCAACVPAADNPGVALGAVLGTLSARGRDKVTLVTSPAIADLGAWLEQLLAESTGKNGKGLIPIDGEHCGPPDVYGDDRVFVYLRLSTDADPLQDAAIDRLEHAGQPIVRLAVPDRYDLGQEFFRWEIATAVTGSLLGINPFDQPDVEASKIATRKLTAQYETSGSLPSETPFLEGCGLRFFADGRTIALLASAGGLSSPTECIKAHLQQLNRGDYFGLLAYVARVPRHDKPIQAIRHAVRDGRRVATCVGYGPRFLHSTGQAYKGGPNSGVFLQITCDDANDIPVPGQKYTFGVVKAAQARGDFDVLVDRGRRALRVHLGPDVAGGLETLHNVVEEALV